VAEFIYLLNITIYKKNVYALLGHFIGKKVFFDKKKKIAKRDEEDN